MKGYRKLIIVAVAVLIATPAMSKQPTKQKSPAPHSGWIAISLRELQERLKGCKEAYPQELLQLCGLKRVTAYMVDQANNDLILKGQTDPQLPPLNLDDLVVALRNVWQKYAISKGNDSYYSDPGCSIDPDPAVMQRLDQGTGQEEQTYSARKIKEISHNFKRICQSSQQVRVEGIPFDTRFAWVMVKADYNMKSIVNGTDNPKISGLTSLDQLMLAQIRQRFRQGADSSPLSSMRRFWFHPGEKGYEEDKGVVIIKRCTVKLLTEEQHFGSQGGFVGTGAPDPLAQEFAESFTAHYAQLAKKRSIYAELDNLFRWVALAKAIKLKSALAEAGLDLGYLLDQYPVSQVPVWRQVSGCAKIMEVKHRSPVPGGYLLNVVWLGLCGGVTIEMDVKNEDFAIDSTGQLAEERQRVLDARPSAGALYWEITFN